MDKLRQWVLNLCISREIRDAVLGDMDEMAAITARETHSDRAKGRFWPHLLRSLPFLLAEKMRRKWSSLQCRMSWLDRGAELGRGMSALPLIGLSLGLAGCLTILTITRDLRTDAHSGDRGRNNGVIDVSDRGAWFLPPSPGSTLLRAGKGDTPGDPESLIILHARRLITIEFMIVFAAGLICINSMNRGLSRQTGRSGLRRVIVRSTGLAAMIFVLARLLALLLLPYFQLLFEKQMLLYWLIAIWLLVGGVSNIVPAIVLSVLAASSRYPRKFAAVYLAFIGAFIFGTLLIFQQLVHLKGAQAARIETRISGVLTDGARGGSESWLPR